MSGKTTKKKRAKPVDQRKLPQVRAVTETTAKNKLDPQHSLAFSILCECNGDWNKVESYFQSPKILLQGGWPNIQALMDLQRPFLDQLYQEARDLHRQYSTPPTDALQ